MDDSGCTRWKSEARESSRGGDGGGPDVKYALPRGRVHLAIAITCSTTGRLQTALAIHEPLVN